MRYQGDFSGFTLDFLEELASLPKESAMNLLEARQNKTMESAEETARKENKVGGVIELTEGNAKEFYQSVLDVEGQQIFTLFYGALQVNHFIKYFCHLYHWLGMTLLLMTLAASLANNTQPPCTIQRCS